ncbi:MAG: hypothetical protein ACTSPI_18160, partial [Candidatus Heimdallarchaeaceae archaeon]
MRTNDTSSDEYAVLGYRSGKRSFIELMDFWVKTSNDIYYNTGKVGIGDSSPDFTLDVAGDIRVQSSNKLYFGGTGSSDNDVNLYRSATNVLKTDDNFDALSLRISGTEVITSGRVLQNISQLDIDTNGTSYSTDKIRIGNPGSGNQVGIFFEDPTANAYGARIYFDDTPNVFKIVTVENLVENVAFSIDRDTGNIGIAKDPTTIKLDVNGGIGINETEVITSTRILQNVTADAGIITSGTFSVDRIPNLSRSKITDFFDSPFWSN